MAANLPTPWLGVTERISIFGYMLWIAVLAIVLLRTQWNSPKLASKVGLTLDEVDLIAQHHVP